MTIRNHNFSINRSWATRIGVALASAMMSPPMSPLVREDSDL